MSDVPVRVRDLTRRYGDFTAVDKVTFEVSRGEIFGFLGPNGAGKTTTIKMLTGLLEPTSGEGYVDGLDIRTDRPRIHTRIGYMSQKFSLYPDLSVGENIELFAGLYGVTERRFDERRAWILGMAELEGAEDRLTGDLPLGWKQRLALGCAVLHEPPILFLDEPTSGVDPVARRRFWDLIDELSRGGTTIFVSTHYMEEAEYCHRLALMNRGKLIALDSPAGLRAAMREPILSLDGPHPAQTVHRLLGSEGVLEASMFGRHVRVVLRAEDDVQSIGDFIRNSLPEIASVTRVRPSLEDVFVSWVRREGGAPA